MTSWLALLLEQD